MSQFTIDKKQEGSDVYLSLKGQIDEDASFAGNELEGAVKVFVDLDEVQSINSCGIREWIKWIRTAPESSQIVYKNCPKVIVDQINMVAGFLPDNGKVESFYVPYYCDETGNEKMILFNEGKEFSGTQVNAPEDVKDDETGDEMEMDVIEAKYFKFLTK